MQRLPQRWRALRSRGLCSDAGADGAASAAPADEKPGAWKWAIRKRMWDLIEKKGIAMMPRPVHNTIPNFRGAGKAADKVLLLPEFREAQFVSVCPDPPQRQVRFITLRHMKVLLVPPAGLKKGFYAVVSPTYLSFYKMRETTARIEGELLGKELGLESDFRVDILVIGSVAVDPDTGARIGAGHGTEELAYALLRHKKIIDDSTLVVTTVHDKQIVNDIPVDKLLPYDLPVDIVCTPNYIYHTNTKIPKPTGIHWDLLLPDKVRRVNVLGELREKIGQETGEKPELAPTGRLFRQGGKPDGPSISVTELNPSITETELKQHLQGMGLQVDSVAVYQTASKKASAKIVIPKDLSAETYAASIDKTELHGWVMQAKPTPTKAKREKNREKNGIADNRRDKLSSSK